MALQLSVMRSVVSHHYWGSPGGGQLVCASAALALDELGYRPVLAGTLRFDPSRYLEWYGIDLTKYEIITLPLGAKAFGLWSRLFVWYPAQKATRRYKPELVFLDEVTYKPLLSQKTFRLVEYVHFPYEVSIDPRFRGSGLAYGEDPYITERYSKFPLNVYWKVYTWLLPRYMRDNPFHAADLVLANSQWTASVAKMVYGEEPKVLNPPLPPNVEVVERPRPFNERRPVVVMLGRFSQEKRYHWVVENVAPQLVKEVPGARLVIFGGAATPTLQAYHRQVWRLAEKAGLRVADNLAAEADVYLIANAPRSLINEVMDEARAFLHATINEHWGIAVAEAMARGLPVVVHKSGGTWTDLAEEGRYGLGYEAVEEAVEALAKLLTQDAKFNTVEKAKELSYPKFRERLAKVLGI